MVENLRTPYTPTQALLIIRYLHIIKVFDESNGYK